MSVTAFQRALCDLVASPDLCLAVRGDPDATLAKYELTPRERTRLREVVWQRGMSTNCTLYRSNRVMPIFTLLNYTWLALGDQFATLIDEFWGAERYQDGQFQSETERFGDFLRRRIAAGAVQSPFAGELLAFELAKNALEFSPRKEVLRKLATLPVADEKAPSQLHPLARIVQFRHDPAILLSAAAAGAMPHEDLPDKNCLVLISVLDGDLMVIQLADGGPYDVDGRIERLPPSCVRALADAGLLVAASGRRGSDLNWHEWTIN